MKKLFLLLSIVLISTAPAWSQDYPDTFSFPSGFWWQQYLPGTDWGEYAKAYFPDYTGVLLIVMVLDSDLESGEADLGRVFEILGIAQ